MRETERKKRKSKTRFLYKFDGSKEIENTWWENWYGMNLY